MRIIRQIRRRLCKHLQTTIHTNTNLPLIVRFINDRNRKRPIGILKSCYFQVFSRTARVNTYGARACETEVTCKGPQTTGYFKCVSLETDEDGVTAG